MAGVRRRLITLEIIGYGVTLALILLTVQVTTAVADETSLVVDMSSAVSPKSDLYANTTTIFISPASMGDAVAFVMIPDQTVMKSKPRSESIVDIVGSSEPLAVSLASQDATLLPQSLHIIPTSIVAPGASNIPCSSTRILSIEEAKTLVEKIATKEHFDVKFALAVAATESHFNSQAISPKGAYGLMQLMPDTAQRLGVDFCDPEQNVRGGIKYLKQLRTQFSNPVYILAAYNAGPDAVNRNGGVPPYPETVSYVANALNAYYGAPLPSNNSDELVAASERPKKRVAAAIAALNASAQNPDGQIWKSGFVINY